MPCRSKAWEWFDTALLVAKGKPVSWLQYTHHASTAILTALNMVRQDGRCLASLLPDALRLQRKIGLLRASRVRSAGPDMFQTGLVFWGSHAAGKQQLYGLFPQS